MQVRLLTIAVAAIAFQACNSSTNNTTSNMTDSTVTTTTNAAPVNLKPKSPKPDWGPSLTDEMAVVIEKLKSYGAPPIETLSAVEARKQPTPAMAVMDVMKDNNIPVPSSGVDTVGKDIPVDGGSIHARVYTPKGAGAGTPLIVYYHGGGWVIADLDTYNASAQGLAEQTGAVVVSVHYRQAPEHRFPTAHNDAFAAYQWVLNNAASLNGDSSRIAVVGESAGGNLACNVSIMARDKGIKIPAYQVLVYPIAGADMNNESYTKYAAAKPLSKPLMQWFAEKYLGDMSKGSDPRITLVKANLKGLPPTTIIGAEIDPLQTEGKALADALTAAGVQVDYKLYNGVTHEFFGMATLLPEAKTAQSVASGALKGALAK